MNSGRYEMNSGGANRDAWHANISLPLDAQFEEMSSMQNRKLSRKLNGTDNIHPFPPTGQPFGTHSEHFSLQRIFLKETTADSELNFLFICLFWNRSCVCWVHIDLFLFCPKSVGPSKRGISSDMQGLWLCLCSAQTTEFPGGKVQNAHVLHLLSTRGLTSAYHLTSSWMLWKIQPVFFLFHLFRRKTPSFIYNLESFYNENKFVD